MKKRIISSILTLLIIGGSNIAVHADTIAPTAPVPAVTFTTTTSDGTPITITTEPTNSNIYETYDEAPVQNKDIYGTELPKFTDAETVRTAVYMYIYSYLVEDAAVRADLTAQINNEFKKYSDEALKKNDPSGFLFDMRYGNIKKWLPKKHYIQYGY